jgi:hypothetical protein
MIDKISVVLPINFADRPPTADAQAARKSQTFKIIFIRGNTGTINCAYYRLMHTVAR